MGIAAEHFGNVYIRTTRAETPVLYKNTDKFKIGGLMVIGKVADIVVIGAGITLHEANKAKEELAKEKIDITVVDLYSIKPIDKDSLTEMAKLSRAFITVEDHYEEGGIGEAVRSAVGNLVPVHSLVVRKMPRSGKPAELLEYEEIDAAAIVKKIKELR